MNPHLSTTESENPMPARPTNTPPAQPDEGHRQRLEALRDRIEQELGESPSSAAVAALARELRAVLADIANLPADGAGPTPLEVLRGERAHRRFTPDAV
jgi:hypothetical protein